MNNTVLSGKWTELKGEIRKMWGSLSDDDIEKTKGNVQSLAGIVQQKYGYAKDSVADKLNELYDHYKFEPSEFAAQATDKVNQKIDTMKEKLKPTPTKRPN